MGAHVELGTYRGVGKVSTWSLEVASMKHPKEVRSFNPVYEQAKSYVFGKVNAAYMARLGWGKRTIATPKLRNGAVAIGWKYALGPCVALTKPVYLEIGYPDIPYSYVLIERYDPSIHGTDDIYGRAGALNGILEMWPQPGAFARVAIDFEYGGQREFLRTASVGANLDAFLTPVEIMAPSTGQNDRLFLTLFVMAPVGERIHADAIQPLVEDQITVMESMERGKAPLAEFMLSQVGDEDLRLFYEISKRPRPATREEVDFVVLVPAFILSEVRLAFQMGFLVLIPFMVIDLVVGSVLMSMGMMMLPPTLIALPVKVMLFVLADGWSLLIRSLVRSFNA